MNSTTVMGAGFAKRESRNQNRFRETQTTIFDNTSTSVKTIMGKCVDFTTSKLNMKIKSSLLRYVSMTF
jgi:hypothetical protein